MASATSIGRQNREARTKYRMRGSTVNLEMKSDSVACLGLSMSCNLQSQSAGHNQGCYKEQIKVFLICGSKNFRPLFGTFQKLPKLTQ